MSNTTSPTGSTGLKSTLLQTVVAAGPTEHRMNAVNRVSRFRHLVPATFAAAAISLGVMTVAAPLAGAEPAGEAKVQKACSVASGTYTTTTVHGHQNSSCDFKGADGKAHVVLYVDGKLVERPY